MTLFKPISYNWFNVKGSPPVESRFYLASVKYNKNVLKINVIKTSLSLRDIFGTNFLSALESAYHAAMISEETLIQRIKNDLLKELSNVDYVALVSYQKVWPANVISQTHGDNFHFFVFAVDVKSSQSFPYSALYFEEDKGSNKALIYIPNSLYRQLTNYSQIDAKITLPSKFSKDLKLISRLFVNNVHDVVAPYYIQARMPVVADAPSIVIANIGTLVALKDTRNVFGRNRRREITFLSDSLSNEYFSSKKDSMPRFTITPSYSVRLSSIYGVEVKVDRIHKNLKDIFDCLYDAAVRLLCKNSQEIVDSVVDVFSKGYKTQGTTLLVDLEKVDTKRKTVGDLIKKGKNSILSNLNGLCKSFNGKCISGRVNTRDLPDPKALLKILASDHIYGPSALWEIASEMLVDVVPLLRISMNRLFNHHLFPSRNDKARVILTEYINWVDKYLHNMYIVTLLYVILKDLYGNNYNTNELLMAAYVLSDTIRMGIISKSKRSVGRVDTDRMAWIAIELGAHGIAHSVVLLDSEAVRGNVYYLLITNDHSLGNAVHPRWVDGGILRIRNLNDALYLFIGLDSNVMIDEDRFRDSLLSEVNHKVEGCYQTDLERVLKVQRALNNVHLSREERALRDFISRAFISINPKNWNEVQSSLTLPLEDSETLIERLYEINGFNKGSRVRKSVLGDIIEAHVAYHFDGCSSCILNEAVNCVVTSRLQKPWRLSLFWAKYILEGTSNSDIVIKGVNRYS